MVSLSKQFRISTTSVSRIIPECTTAIWQALKHEFMPVPTSNTWIESASQFHELWNLPNCVGAIDGKHIRLQCPANSGSCFINYKSFFSIVLQAVVDANGMFMAIDVGDYGRNSDAGVFANSEFGKAFNSEKINLPKASILPGTHQEFPYFLVGDEAYPLQTKLMRPFPRRQLDDKRRIFNYRLSRARKVVELAFGLLATKWRIFRQPLAIQPEKAKILVCAACVLHNFVRYKEGKSYTPDGQRSLSLDADEPFTLDSVGIFSGRPGNKAIEYRRCLKIT